MCRESVQKLITLYFEQLTRGCGHENCTNYDCANGKSKRMEPSQAAAIALLLVAKGTSKLCKRSALPESQLKTDGSITNFWTKWSSLLQRSVCKNTVNTSLSAKHTSDQLTRFVYCNNDCVFRGRRRNNLIVATGDFSILQSPHQSDFTCVRTVIS